MIFVEPLYCLLFLPLAAGLWLSFRHVHGMGKAAKRTAFIFRALLASLLIVALMGPQWRQPNEGLGVVFVVDRSDSIRSADREAAYRYVKKAASELGPSDSAAVVVFGRTAVVESMPGGRRDLAPFSTKVDGSATDVAAAIRLATAIAPEGKGRRAVVLTDANETLGDASEAVEAARMGGVQVDFVALSTLAQGAEAALISVEAPPERKADEPFDVRVTLSSTRPQSATLILDREGVVVSRQTVQLDQGTTSVVIPQRIARSGFFRYRATVTPSEDSDPRNNVGAGYVEVSTAPQVLVLSGPKAGRALSQALKEQGLRVTEGDAGLAPFQIQELQPYDAVILNDVNAADVPIRSMEILEQGVRAAGIGLVMIGGENSFLPGGWYGSPVADALPVDLDVKQRKSVAAASILIMVDASGSMGAIEGGQPKIRLAAKAAEFTASLLTPMDRLAVGGSSDGIQLVLPFTKLTDKAAAIAKIRTLAVNGGGIFAEPTIIRAERLLNGEQSKVRHFILLADGDDTSDYGQSFKIVSRMKADKITTSVVAIGKGKDLPFLKSLAAAGGGGYYLVESAEKLPAIFTQDVSLITRSAIEEGAFTPKITGSDPLMAGIFDQGSPPLLAYCLVDSRPIAQTLLRTPKDDPLLAVWQYGLGRSLAFTSDAQPRWADSWTRWSEFGPFWSQAVRSVMRRSMRGQYLIETEPKEGRVEVMVSRLGGQEGAPPPGKTVVSGPGGKEEVLDLTEEAPGVYRGWASAPDPGAYLVTVADPDGQGRSRVQTAGFAVSYPQEYRAYAPQGARITQLAEQGGGRKLSQPSEALRPLDDPGATIRDVWIWLVLAAALLLPLDVALRRISIPWAELRSRVAARLRKAPSAPEADPRLARLKGAKARPEPPSGPPVPGQPAASSGPPKPGTPSARPPASPPSEADGSSRERLLAARRKRKGD